jgi:hypothetical protein
MTEFMTSEFFLYGVMGGVFAELLGLYKLRTQAPSAFPTYLRSGFYWSVTIAMVFAGGVLVWVYNHSGLDMKPLIAVNIGASAPLILGSLIQTTPPKID